ncbi:MAG: hypothetical protein ACLP4V_19970, partial [Methylocella sp.]
RARSATRFSASRQALRLRKPHSNQITTICSSGFAILLNYPGAGVWGERNFAIVLNFGFVIFSNLSSPEYSSEKRV